MQYRVQLRSTPGPYAQYDGEVDVFCDSSSPEDIFRAAVSRLARTSFPDRASLDFWVMESFAAI